MRLDRGRAAEHADRLFAGSDRPTCVVAASDEMAFGVMSAARRHGLEVPGDVSVIGIDDHVHAGIFDLTTVRQDVEAQGRQAGALMLDALHGQRGESTRTTTSSRSSSSSAAPPLPRRTA